MNEIKRILFSKKYIGIVLVLLLANLFVFQYFQMSNPESKEESIRQCREEQKECKKEFYKKANGVAKQAEELSGVSIFADADSFVNKNIFRTRDDFLKIKDVKIDTNISDYAVRAFFGYDELYYFAFALIVITVLLFFDERKAGLWQLTYACKKGRLQLAVKRLLLLLGVAVVFTGLLFFETFVLSFFDFGGSEILFSTAQSVTVLQNFTMPFTVFQTVLYFWAIVALTMFVSGLVIWGILSLIHNKNLGILVLAVVYGIEIVLSHLNPLNPICVLKYFNLWFFMDPRQIVLEYVNFSLGSFLLNQREFVLWSSLVLATILAPFLCAVNAHTKPVYVPGRLERIAETVSVRGRRILSVCNGFFYELYKMLFQGRGFFVLMIFIYLIMSGISSDDWIFGSGEEFLNDFYQKNTSEMNEKNMESYDQIVRELNAAYENIEKAKTKEEKKYAQSVAESYASTQYMIEKLNQRLKYVKKLEKRGIAGWWVNEDGYHMLLGKRNFTKRMLDGFLSIAALVLMLSGMFAYERQSGVCHILRCTPKGRLQIFTRKYGCAILSVILVSGISIGAEIYEVRRWYRLDGLDAPVQNLALLEKMPIQMSIRQFLVIWIGLRVLAFLAVACLTLLISVLFNKPEKAQMISFVLLILGAVSGVSEYMILGSGKMVKTVLVITVLVTLVIGSTIITYRIWRNRYA